MFPSFIEQILAERLLGTKQYSRGVGSGKKIVIIYPAFTVLTVLNLHEKPLRQIQYHNFTRETPEAPTIWADMRFVLRLATSK